MITADEALIALYKAAQGTYTVSESYTCTPGFGDAFPDKSHPAFRADGLPPQIGGNGWTRTSDKLHMKQSH